MDIQVLGYPRIGVTEIRGSSSSERNQRFVWGWLQEEPERVAFCFIKNDVIELIHYDNGVGVGWGQFFGLGTSVDMVYIHSETFNYCFNLLPLVLVLDLQEFSRMDNHDRQLCFATLLQSGDSQYICNCNPGFTLSGR